MSKGRRYEGEQKLNLKKVVAVVAVIAVITLAIFGIKKILSSDKNKVMGKNIELHYFTLFKNGNCSYLARKKKRKIFICRMRNETICFR